ncbi:MAG: GTPase HflX [Bacillota bacterium]|nr:GTPase HflX [Bacillota bacterium]
MEELHRAKDRVLLVAVEFSARRAALLPSALLAREARKLAEPAPAAQAREVPAADELLMEFRELVLSAGAEIAGEFVQRRPKPDPATLIGSGKVRELAGVVAATGANAALFDHDLTPTQLRNLEAALPCRVLDRTQLILDIFARHARTREGQLQVELAQLEYLLPRLAGRGKAMSQLGGGIGTRGPGETQLETDRRKLQRRIVQLKHDLEAVRRVRGQQRQRREAVPVPTVALVGYTNAGKSTLFNALTQAGVVESSRMFATLDPKLKAVVLPSRRKVLLSDTVGFIRNLPHTLVSSFRATLEEVQKAEVLLHVRDASSPARDEHKAEVEKVLAELEAVNKPCIEVMNKVDLLSAEERETAASGGGVLVSARMREGLDALLARLDEALVGDPVMEQTMIVPQSRGDVLAALEAGAVIREREFRDNAVRMQLAGPASLLGRYREFREKAKTDRASGSGGDSQMPGPSDPEPGHRW